MPHNSSAGALGALVFFLLTFGGTAAHATPGPEGYVRYTFTPVAEFGGDETLKLDRLEVFVALNAVDAPHFLRSFGRTRTREGADRATSDALELKYLKHEDYADVHRATVRQLQQFAGAIGQPLPPLPAPPFAPGTRLALSWVNTFARSADALMHGRPARFVAHEYTIAMRASSYQDPGATFPIAVFVRRVEWDSISAGPLEIHQRLLTGTARRAALDEGDRALVADLLQLHHCQAALN